MLGVIIPPQHGGGASQSEGPSIIKRKKYTADVGLVQPSPLLAAIVRDIEVALACGLEEWWGQPNMVVKIKIS